jgi:hypothetical protein
MSSHPLDFFAYPFPLTAANIFIALPCVKGAGLIITAASKHGKGEILHNRLKMARKRRIKDFSHFSILH